VAIACFNEEGTIGETLDYVAQVSTMSSPMRSTDARAGRGIGVDQPAIAGGGDHRYP